MNWLDLVRLISWVSGGRLYVSEVDADYILWEHTAFPFADPAHIARQLTAYFDDPTFTDDPPDLWGDR